MSRRIAILLTSVGLAVLSLILLVPSSTTSHAVSILEAQQMDKVVAGACYWTDVVNCDPPSEFDPGECPDVANASGNCGDGNYIVEDERWVAKTSLSKPGWTDYEDWGKIHCYETYSCEPYVVDGTTYCQQGSWMSNSLEHNETVGLGGETCNDE
ncbi:MAG: hypothetical protein KDB05_19975 [Planctomycetales bacterium]|nr:hypothetical protein [Planctomycetales bacterium]